MSIHIRYFAAAAEAAGRDEEHLEIEAGATLSTLKAVLIERYGALMQRVVESGSFLIDGVVRRDPAHAVGARVDVLPPFAGG
ncbi:MoaD/ThiS family protein [Salinibacterium sp. SWN248]|uniref:MoaD/ThiS family protein n=1 Tax=Salinibacterium sp. SWN248 TaxID=2792056 RepID=UPI0018CDF1D2|nr:MoaD/ThiS family protein [Salinibacterium sp. SWN248]MBH0023173.1 MoaD/ThiS family protein [Salinibacterium sp. SWN248]